MCVCVCVCVRARVCVCMLYTECSQRNLRTRNDDGKQTRRTKNFIPSQVDRDALKGFRIIHSVYCEFNYRLYQHQQRHCIVYIVINLFLNIAT